MRLEMLSQNARNVRNCANINYSDCSSSGITMPARLAAAYLCTDSLAFAHPLLAIAFIGPLRDSVRNRWVLVFGMIE